MDIPLNGKTMRPTSLSKLRKAEVAELFFKPNDPAEKQVFTIELKSVPCPIAIRGEKLTNDQRVFLMFL